jgi:hypothetical protein
MLPVCAIAGAGRVHSAVNAAHVLNRVLVLTIGLLHRRRQRSYKPGLTLRIELP